MSSQQFFLPSSPGRSIYLPVDHSNDGAGTSWPISHNFALNGSNSHQAINNSSPAPFSFPSKTPDLASLLWVPEIKKLHHDFQSVTAMSTGMYQERRDLELQIKNLREEIAGLREENILLKRNGDARSHGVSRRTSYSVGPSDSISQQSSRPSTGLGHIAAPVSDVAQSSKRPEKFPLKILWYKSDCKDDTDACPSDGNPSRPPMKKAIRNEQGEMISDEYYNSLLKSAALYINELALLVHTKAPMQPPRKSYIEKHFPSQWRDAINKIEIEHPPLGLCASHWKADQLLSEMLRSRKASTDDDTTPTNNSSSSKRKRGNSGTQTAANNKPKKWKPKRRGTNTSNSEHEDNSNIGTNVSTNNPPPSSDPEPSVSSKPVALTASSVAPVPNPKGKAKVKEKSYDFENFTWHALTLGRGNPTTVVPAPQQVSIDPDNASSSVRPLPEPSILSMIGVKATYTSLKDASTQEFANIPHLPDCLELLKSVSESVNYNGQPCSQTLALLARIESADPAMPDIDEDDTNVGWGHIQFTAGGMTLSTVLQSWNNIGNVATAYRLLAATMKTCRVARHLCFTNNIVITGGYLADSYLQNLVGLICDMLKTTTPERTNPPTTAIRHNTTNTQSISRPPASPQLSGDHPSSNPAQQSTSSVAPEGPAVDNMVQDLHRDELKKWILTKKITMPSKQNKQDLIDAIRESKILPTREEFELFVTQRKKKQPSRKPKGTT